MHAPNLTCPHFFAPGTVSSAMALCRYVRAAGTSSKLSELVAYFVSLWASVIAGSGGS